MPARARRAARLGACGDEEPGMDEPAREGLAIEMGGVDYNVFITRQLNPRHHARQGLLTEEPPPGETLYGVFLQVCNISDGEARDGQRRVRDPRQPGERVRARASCPRTTSSPTRRAARPRGVHPRGRQRGPARPDRRLDAAVQAPAREHREPAARARDRGQSGDEARTFELRYLARCSERGARSTTRAAGAAVARRPPLRDQHHRHRDRAAAGPARRP